jgi:chaperonin GroES
MKKKNIKSSRGPSAEKAKTPENETRIRPFGDRILVRPFTEQALREAQGKKTSFDIILPDSVTKEKSAQGKVLAVGEGKWVKGNLVPVRIQVGDTVVFSKYGYDEVEHNGEELYLLKEENILAIIK